MNPTIRISAFLLCVFVASFAFAADYPPPNEGDYTIRDFKFASGEILPELRLHYRTLGKPEKDAKGKTTNTVLIKSFSLGPNGIIGFGPVELNAVGQAGWLYVQSDANLFGATLFVINTIYGGGSFTAQTPLCEFS